MFESFELNIEAKEYFNQKAQEFLFSLKPLKKKAKGQSKSSSFSHVHTKTIDDKKIIKMGNMKLTDGFGNDSARFFNHNGNWIGIEGDDYEKVKTFLKNIYKKRQINKLVHQDFIEEKLFEWFNSKYSGIIKEDESFIKYLEECSKAEIKKYKVSIPIDHLTIHKNFKLSGVTYEFYQKEYFDELLGKLLKRDNNEKEKNESKEIVKKLQKDYQGVVFISLILEAERERAIERAIEIVDLHIKLLRCFSPSTFIPEVPSYFNRKGRGALPETTIFLFEKDFPNVITSIDENREFMFHINNELLSDFSKIGYLKVFDLVMNEKFTQFENTLLNIITLFSKSISANEFQDKLVFALVALEVLLLKNESEPIQNSVGTRLAFLTRKEVTDRKEIIKLIKECYKIRSSYIHHGKITENIEMLQNLYHLVWQSIVNVIRSLDKFKTQTDFVDYLEEQILS